MYEPKIIRRRAWRQEGEGVSPNPENNFVAGGDTAATRGGGGIAGPDRGNRKGAGARRGNTNAKTHGLFVQARRAQAQRLRDLLRRNRALIAAVDALAAARTRRLYLVEHVRNGAVLRCHVRVRPVRPRVVTGAARLEVAAAPPNISAVTCPAPPAGR